MFVGLIAIVIASVINIFIGSSVMQMVISALAIVIFMGLTAYDTQKIREEVSYDNDGIAEIRGALTLYLDFINLFLNLLNLFGDYLPTKISTLFFEVLYRPWPTVLLSRWRKNGGETMDGIDLLVHQAIEQISLFSDKTVDRASMAHELRKAAVATLE